MSKTKKKGRNKHTPKSKVVKVRKKPAKKSVRRINLERSTVVSAHDRNFKQIFRIVAGIIAIVTIMLSLNSGINGDDEYQNDYSEKLVNYYLTAGSDSSAVFVEKGNMHYYGGFFDLLTGVVNYSLGFDDTQMAYHQVRHFFNAVFGWLIILFVGLLAKEIAGWRAGILALFLAFVSPRLMGHALMNPKDIPFAAGFTIALYYLTLLLKQMPKPKWQTGLGVAVGIALALATRAGGLLLVAYLALFVGLDFLLRYGFKGISTEVKKLGRYAVFALGISILAYLLAILTWPAALVDPLGHPFEALTNFSKLGVKIRLLFMGENVMSDDTAWFYPVVWIAKTIPLFTLLGFLGGFILVDQLLRKYVPLPVVLLFFASVFPVAYVIYKESILHDGWRHLLFVYPSMVVIATLFWIRVEELVRPNKFATYALWVVLGLSVLEPALFIVRNPAFPYVYFNPIGGGLAGSYGDYETDYWGLSVKPALDWMEDEGILSKNRNDTVIIGTTFYYNVSRLTQAYDGKVVTKYVRFNTRYSEDWDYGIFPSRFIRSEHLQSGNWPNSKTIHIVKANGIPLAAIEKQTDDNAYQAELAIKNKNWESAIDYYQREVENFSDNELAWQGQANAYLNLNNNEAAKKAAEKLLEVAPKNENGLYFMGLAHLKSGNVNEAVTYLQDVLKVNDSFYVADYYLAIIYQQSNQLEMALKHALNTIKSNPKFKAGYELVANIYAGLGNTQEAEKYRILAKRI